MLVKTCSNCKQQLAVEEFHRKGDGHQPNCKSCQNAINRERYRQNKDAHIKHVAANVKARNEKFYKWKQTLQCTKCGELHPSCLDFHHLNSHEKEFHVSDACYKKGWGSIIAEIAKCVVLCKNCHHKVHDGVLTVNEDDVVDDQQINELRSMTRTTRCKH
jgi:hypothetical protein